MTDPTRRIADGFSFLESPRWWRGDLYVSDFYTHRVLRFPGGGGRAALVCEVPGQPSGLVPTPAGDLLIVSMLDRTLRRWDGGQLHTVADLSDLATGPLNDMVGDDNGRVWIGNFGDDGQSDGGIGPAAILTVGPGGDTAVAAADVNFPNGMVLTDGGATLLVAETFAARITAFTVGADGMLSGRRVWADFGVGDLWNVPAATMAQPVLPDGLAEDAEGALWVADAKGSGVIRVAEGGQVLDRVDTGELAVYSAALGGAAGRELVLCCAPPLGTSDPVTARRSQLMVTTVPVPAKAETR
jgi:sugar lactone lactonase YvrE